MGILSLQNNETPMCVFSGIHWEKNVCIVKIYLGVGCAIEDIIVRIT